MDDFQNYFVEMKNVPIGPQIEYLFAKYLGDRSCGCFHSTVVPKMQSQKCNFTTLQLQHFLVNYGLYELSSTFGFYI
jgi:hypothetical protein